MKRLQPHLVQSYAQSKIASHGMIPYLQPALPSTSSVIAILHGRSNWVQAKDVTTSSEYTALIAESKKPGSTFTIDGLYSVDNKLLELCFGEDLKKEGLVSQYKLYTPPSSTTPLGGFFYPHTTLDRNCRVCYPVSYKADRKRNVESKAFFTLFYN